MQAVQVVFGERVSRASVCLIQTYFPRSTYSPLPVFLHDRTPKVFGLNDHLGDVRLLQCWSLCRSYQSSLFAH